MHTLMNLGYVEQVLQHIIINQGHPSFKQAGSRWLHGCNPEHLAGRLTDLGLNGRFTHD